MRYTPEELHSKATRNGPTCHYTLRWHNINIVITYYISQCEV